MAQKILILILSFLSFQSYSQNSPSKEDGFTTYSLQLERNEFNLVEVIDNRFFPHKYGFEKKNSILNSMDFSESVQNWFSSSYPFKKNLLNIAIRINEIEINAYNSKASDIECNGSIDIYLKKENKYLKIAE
jgi:hypothetical protein